MKTDAPHKALKEFNIHANNSRGLEHVRQIIFWLEQGDFSNAQAKAEIDWDKSDSYPELCNILFHIFPEIYSDKCKFATNFGFKAPVLLPLDS